MIHSHLHDIPNHARVFLRIDANIPIVQGTIYSDFRLEALKPTFNLLVAKKAHIILATHIGRPKKYTPALSTKILLPWFTKHGYTAQFAATIQEAYSASIQNKPMITILENLRFFAGEKSGDHTFAQKLSQLADYYVNDAFATLHRYDTSIAVLPSFFEKKTVGLLIENEIQHLQTLLSKPRAGYTFILGGGKITTKIPLLEHFIDKVDTILLLPAIVFTFLKAQGYEVGSSLIDDAEIKTCIKIIEHAKKYGTQIVYPLDYQVAQDSLSGPLSLTADSIIPPNYIGVSVGPRSLKAYTDIISKSSTIFYNGLMGALDIPNTVTNTQKLFTIIALSNSYSIISGGDSIALIEKSNLAHHMSYLSTGGAATLTFLSRKPLPGLIALSE